MKMIELFTLAPPARKLVSYLLITFLCIVVWPTDAQDKDEGLWEMDLEELMNMNVVSASRKAEKLQDAPGIVQVITKEEIAAYGYTQLYDVLNRATSTFIFNTYFQHKTALSMRGNRPTSHYNNHVLIMVNGRPFRETGYTGVDTPIFTGFPVSSIERIEIVRGAGSVLYGSNAFDGSINIITTKEAEEIMVKLGIGNQSNVYFEGSASGEIKGTQISASIYGNKRKGEVFHGTDEIGTDFSFENNDNSVGGGLSIKNGGFTSTAFVAHTNHGHIGVLPFVNFPTNPTLVDDLNTPGGFVFDSRKLMATKGGFDVGYSLSFSDKLTGQLNTSINTMDMQFSYLFGGLTVLKSVDYLTEAIFFFTPSQNINIVAGTSVNVLTGENISVGLDYNEAWYAAYVQGDYRPVKSLKLIGGIQLNSPNSNIITVVPRFGAIYNLSESMAVKALYGKAFRSPMPFEQSLNAPQVLIGNPDLKPEFNENIDLQLSYQGHAVRFSATGFAYKSTELISRTLAEENVTPSYTNRGEATGYGLELEGTVKTGGFGFNGALTLQHNELTDQFGIGEADTTISNYTLMPNVMPKIGFYYANHGAYGAGLFYNGMMQMHEWGGAATTNPFSSKLNIVSLNMYVDILKVIMPSSEQSLMIEFYGDNLLDEKSWYPEFVRRNVNSVPGYQRRFFRIGLIYKI